ncbi:hypothetical protein [Actinoallomurus soli]|uniref:hypothetical protein n=1 Tax=Actinoallomurus soli TaxID=2952535 RepID=UPI002093BC5D|nr:hypothetical protein [Actinoallomurus soli]MCO5975050.1 hypothetical protein [Actinoallomurus soli]
MTSDGTPGQTDQTGGYGAAGVAGTVVIADAGAQVGSAQLTHGAVTIPLPARLAAGSHLLRVAYTPTTSSYTAPAITTTSVKINKAAPKLTGARAHRGKSGRARLIIRASAKHLRPSGPVTVRAQGMKRILRAHLRDGKVIVTLPRLGAGPRRVTVTYRGSSNIRRASVSKSINLAVG